MPQSISEEEIHKIAEKRIADRRGFYSNLTCYITINIILIIVWYTTGSGSFWPLWILIIWGIAIIGHGVVVFVRRDPRLYL